VKEAPLFLLQSIQ